MTIQNTLPDSAVAFARWPWSDIEPLYTTLLAAQLTDDTIESWLDDWTALHAMISEAYSRLHVAAAQNTEDEQAEETFQEFVENIYLAAQPHEQRCKEKLIASGIEPPDFSRPLANQRCDIQLFREENLPLMAESERLSNEYSRISGAQTVTWKGEEKTIQQLKPVLESPDRNARERAWRAIAERQLADRTALNDLWVRFLKVRKKLAANAGLDSYQHYRWQQMRRLDYSPEDTAAFRHAIRQTVVPAANRIYQRRAEHLGLDLLRPWDVEGQPADQQPLSPFSTIQELEETSSTIFHAVDGELGQQFDTMRREGLLDLENRKAKAPGGFCTFYPVVRRPFIFMNAVGTQDDVRTIVHEAGHCFHDFATGRWHLQWEFGIEFAEVASMAMELLSAPYWGREKGGFYNRPDAARARIDHLENNILFWPYMAVVDGFQHWAYTNSEKAAEPAACDAAWSELWDQFMPAIDFSGCEEVKKTGWHRKLHIFQHPMYYVEYGLAQLGAVQVWANSLDDHASAVQAYKKALSLGARPLPELFETAGARFAFDAETLGEAVAKMEDQIERLLEH